MGYYLFFLVTFILLWEFQMPYLDLECLDNFLKDDQEEGNSQVYTIYGKVREQKKFHVKIFHLTEKYLRTI